jgi:hypothetical protein
MVRFSGQSLLIVIGMDNDGNVVAHATHRCFVLLLMGLMEPFTSVSISSISVPRLAGGVEQELARGQQVGPVAFGGAQQSQRSVRRARPSPVKGRALFTIKPRVRWKRCQLFGVFPG